MLLFFAFFFIAFFGLFAVVVDLGIARTTQMQMQNSADVAALEGLAGRDAVLGDPAAADLQRRQLAALFATLVHDDDLVRGTANTGFLLGAGPTLETGVGGVADPAGGLLVSDGPWIPALQTNEAANRSFGDLVAGQYAALELGNEGRVDWHTEASDYARNDFEPNAAGNAFLARLRRTRGNNAVDDVPGVSSAGPTIPYLFGLGSGALSTPDPDVYDPRRDGLTIRATAIADGRRVTAAGLALPGFPGLAPLVTDSATGAVRWLSFEETSWGSLLVGESFTVTVAGTGAISGTVDGQAVHGSPTLGGALVATGPVTLPPAPSVELDGLVYASLHRPAAGGELRVRGFVAVQIVTATIEADATLRLVGVKLGDTIAPRNASAQPTLASDLNFATPAPAGPELLAPAIAR